ALIGERLLASPVGADSESRPSWRDDPVWSLLAQLSEGGDAPPGVGFAAPQTWRGPAGGGPPFATDGCARGLGDSPPRPRAPAGFLAVRRRRARATPFPDPAARRGRRPAGPTGPRAAPAGRPPRALGGLVGGLPAGSTARRARPAGRAGAGRGARQRAPA